MSIQRGLSIATIAVVLAGFLAASAEAVEPAPLCESNKLKTTGEYAACLLDAESKAVKSGGSSDVSKCDAKFTSEFLRFETKAGPGVCPSEGDVSTIKAEVNQATKSLAGALKIPPGSQGKGRLVTSAAVWWKDTDGVSPRQAGCHQAYLGTDNGEEDCGEKKHGPGTRIGEACLPVDGGGILLVETNPGAGECHEHHKEKVITPLAIEKEITGHPNLYSCQAFCQARFNANGTCVSVPNRCGPNNHSARCECVGITTTTSVPLTTTTSTITTTTIP